MNKNLNFKFKLNKKVFIFNLGIYLLILKSFEGIYPAYLRMKLNKNFNFYAFQVTKVENHKVGINLKKSLLLGQYCLLLFLEYLCKVGPVLLSRVIIKTVHYLVDLFKVRPILRGVFPTFEHETVHLIRGVVRRGHPVTCNSEISMFFFLLI